MHEDVPDLLVGELRGQCLVVAGAMRITCPGVLEPDGILPAIEVGTWEVRRGRGEPPVGDADRADQHHDEGQQDESGTAQPAAPGMWRLWRLRCPEWARRGVWQPTGGGSVGLGHGPPGLVRACLTGLRLALFHGVPPSTARPGVPRGAARAPGSAGWAAPGAPSRAASCHLVHCTSFARGGRVAADLSPRWPASSAPPQDRGCVMPRSYKAPSCWHRGQRPKTSSACPSMVKPVCSEMDANCSSGRQSGTSTTWWHCTQVRWWWCSSLQTR